MATLVAAAAVVAAVSMANRCPHPLLHVTARKKKPSGKLQNLKKKKFHPEKTT